ncbi:hypothetical protein N7478_012818 [Penicillium angulare]|uniref:uncharacterized protein n=1 Tax=Penicillium angulare TaxID=116970 RepID=UPI002540CBDB|nr:uncharacterized protein N7478_012818 [Penicillium angulare]KAJ5256714.1 hypothetical protein N7478_012818 [Penicillium angulare]
MVEMTVRPCTAAFKLHGSIAAARILPAAKLLRATVKEWQRGSGLNDPPQGADEKLNQTELQPEKIDEEASYRSPLTELAYAAAEVTLEDLTPEIVRRYSQADQEVLTARFEGQERRRALTRKIDRCLNEINNNYDDHDIDADDAAPQCDSSLFDQVSRTPEEPRGPKNVTSYKEKNASEARVFFNRMEGHFRASPAWYAAPGAKVNTAVELLGDNCVNIWKIRRLGYTEPYHWSDFKDFCLSLVDTKVNISKDAAFKYYNSRQRPHQSELEFSAYLKSQLDLMDTSRQTKIESCCCMPKSSTRSAVKPVNTRTRQANTQNTWDGYTMRKWAYQAVEVP